MANQPKLTRDQQREAARAKARDLREKQQASEKRKKLTIQVSVVVALLAVVGIIVLSLVSSPSTQGGEVPKKVAIFSQGGIKIGADLKAFTKTVSPTAKPTPSSTPGTTPASVPNIKMYLDYQCPYCQQFEAANTTQIQDWVSKGVATIEFHPISFLDPNSANHYSSRAANAAYCVAENSPDAFFNYNSLLYANQPAEGSAGPDNNALYQDAVNVGATNLPVIQKCINSNAYGKWIADTTTSLLTPGKTIPETKFQLNGTPFVMVNNQQYTYATNEERNDPARFNQFVQSFSAQ
jgi:protein-disulfide isomerase